MKTAAEKIEDLKVFLPNAKQAITKLEELYTRLETEEEFRNLWNSDSAACLREVGIEPDARTEMGLGPYPEGPECNMCITPKGNACHC